MALERRLELEFLSTDVKSDGIYAANKVIGSGGMRSAVYKRDDFYVDKVVDIGALDGNNALRSKNGLKYKGDNIIEIDEEKTLSNPMKRLLLDVVSEYNTLYTIQGCRKVTAIDPTFSTNGPAFAINGNHLYAALRTSYHPGKELAQIPVDIFSPSDIARITIDIIDALEELAAVKVIHRDVKPGNIIYDSKRGKSTLIDFGIAYSQEEEKKPFITSDLKMLLQERVESEEECLVGTPSFMSPEHVNKNFSEKSDWFSFGLTLYTLITKRAMHSHWDSPWTIFNFLQHYDRKSKLWLMSDVYHAIGHSLKGFPEGIESVLDEDPEKRNLAPLREAAQSYLQKTAKPKSWFEKIRWLFRPED